MPAEWYALQTRPRYERFAATALAEIGYERFLPLMTVRHRWSDRVANLEVPVFPGYVFCRFDANVRLPVLLAPGVCRIVGLGKTPVPVDPAEIAAIRSVVESGLRATPWPYLDAGTRVRIVGGPLRGVEGILLKVASTERLVVGVSLLRRSLSVEIDETWAMPVNALEQRMRDADRDRRLGLGRESKGRE